MQGDAGQTLRPCCSLGVSPGDDVCSRRTSGSGSLTLVSEIMIPEAFHGSPQFNGLLVVVGFVALLILLVLSH